MLLEALVACAGVTMKAVATSIGIALRSGKVEAEGDLDFRGTLGVDKQAPVGFTDIRLKFELDTDAPQDQLDTLLEAHRALLRRAADPEASAGDRGDGYAGLRAEGAPQKNQIVQARDCSRRIQSPGPNVRTERRRMRFAAGPPTFPLRTILVDARNDMLDPLRSRREGFTLPRPFYVDADYFRLDLEMIWYRDWLFVGHDCELDRPGSFMTVQIGDYPVVLVRDLKGTDPRIPQHVPASWQPCLRGGEGRSRSGSSAPITSGATTSTAASCSPARWPKASTSRPMG